MLSRRQFLVRGGSAGAALLVAPQTAVEALARPKLLRGGKFSQGVLSGDPTPHGITLLTVLDEVTGAGTVKLEVARDRDFRHVVARETIATSGKRNHSVKARVGHLAPHERYYYRFETRDHHSPVGRFQTALPPDSRQPVKFAFFSCADYTHGYYNGYDLMRREDVDFVVCLGDYIYAEAYHTRAGGTGVRDDSIGRPNSQTGYAHESLTLDDYRAKYALYRSDRTLRKLHARVPMITIWDDHEVQNNYAGGERDGGLDPAYRFSQARKRAAYKAFFESMPFYGGRTKQVYRHLRQGRHVDLILPDQRKYRADQPCGDAVSPPCADWDQPRDFLGRTQMNWLKRRLSASKATWKVIGSETLMMPAKVTGGAYYQFDSWQGYPREREELLAHIKNEGIDDVVFLTGDIHIFLAGDVRTQMGDGPSVAVEFVGGSITSQNFGETDINAGSGVVIPGDDQNPHTDPAIYNVLRSVNPWIDQADFDHHGYGLVKATGSHFDCTFKRLATIKHRSRQTLTSNGYSYRLARGQKSIKGVNGPPA
ncbi:MAG: alkaline phosphatase D family protein [Solirubrobacterales bacterium]